MTLGDAAFKVASVIITGVTFAAGGVVVTENTSIYIGGVILLMTCAFWLGSRLTKGSEQMRNMSEQIKELQSMNTNAEIASLKAEVKSLKQAANQMTQQTENLIKKNE